MAFNESERTDVRRFCGYPAFGAGVSGFQNWRFYQAYGLMEFRLNYLTGAEQAVVRRYLAQLHQMETAIPTTAQGLDIAEAGPFVRNPQELRERTTMFDGWRRRLCGFLGVPAGPGLGDGGLRFVV